MAQGPSEGLSDIERARTIALRLLSSRAPVVDAKPPPPSYVRFRAPRATHEGARDEHLETAPPSVSFRGADSFGVDAWNRVLDWCNSVCGSTVAFAMDAHGLAIAARGPIEPEEVDTIGTRLMIALEQASLMRHGRPPARAIVIEFADQWVTGLSLSVDDGVKLTLGLVGTAPASQAARERMLETIRAMFSGGGASDVVS